MIRGTLRYQELAGLDRLDAWYYLAPGAGAARRIDSAAAAGLQLVPIGGSGGLGRAWMPGRMKQAIAAQGEDSRPYVKPHDLFQYLPEAHVQLSTKRTKRLDDYLVEPGLLLQTRSGRNLGLNALVDTDIARYVVSDDLIRISISDERMRFYATAFLRSRTGQGLLRRDKSGSVIDHLSPEQIEALPIPLAPADVIDSVADLMQASFEVRQESRRQLRIALSDYEEQLPPLQRFSDRASGWSVSVKNLSNRLDAASYDPLVAEIQTALVSMGGVPLSDVAVPLKPPGRYKTIYVGHEHGLPFMSGTQILQYSFSKPQYMSPRVFKDPAVYKLRAGWTVYMADGRSEKNLGVPALVTSARDGWVASGHVGRLEPKQQVDAGWIWLAARTRHVGLQLESMASGSVVDSTFPHDAASVVLPPRLDVDGEFIVSAWEGFARAQQLEVEAILLLDSALAEISGVRDDELESAAEFEATGLGALDPKTEVLSID